MQAAAVALVIGLALAGWRQRGVFTCLRLDGPWMPEREAGAFILANRLEGRLLSWFDWGQYAIWHFAPRLKVSLDGRRETVYSDAFVAQHLKLYYEPDTSLAMLDELAPAYAWLPTNLPLSAALNRAGWRRIYTGPASIVFAREKSSLPDMKAVSTATLGPACFRDHDLVSASTSTRLASVRRTEVADLPAMARTCLDPAHRNTDGPRPLGTPAFRPRLARNTHPALGGSLFVHTGQAVGQPRVAERSGDGGRVCLLGDVGPGRAQNGGRDSNRRRGVAPSDRIDPDRSCCRDNCRDRLRPAPQRHDPTADMVAPGACAAGNAARRSSADLATNAAVGGTLRCLGQSARRMDNGWRRARSSRSDQDCPCTW